MLLELWILRDGCYINIHIHIHFNVGEHVDFDSYIYFDGIFDDGVDFINAPANPNSQHKRPMRKLDNLRRFSVWKLLF
ncbi:hypothetical protein CFE70_003886 [Pyrenophora teres f. teres 0-1]